MAYTDKTEQSVGQLTDGRDDRTEGPVWQRPAAVLAGLGIAAVAGGLVGYQWGQPSAAEQHPTNPHPLGMIAVYDKPYDPIPENIRGFITGPFDIYCGYYSPENSPPPNQTGLKPDYIFVEGTSPQNDQIVGFVKFTPGMREVGEFGNCADQPPG